MIISYRRKGHPRHCLIQKKPPLPNTFWNGGSYLIGGLVGTNVFGAIWLTVNSVAISAFILSAALTDRTAVLEIVLLDKSYRTKTQTTRLLFLVRFGL